MNREIKFRGRRVDNGEFVFGHYHSCVGPGTISYWDSFAIPEALVHKHCDFDQHWILVTKTPSDSGWEIRDTFFSYSVIPDTVGQYSGLKDKNGIEIYEGDIVSFIDAINHPNESTSDNWEDEQCYGVIWFDTENGRWECTNRLSIGIDQFIEEIQENCTVIGNIYENPGLIDAEATLQGGQQS